jgi:outer membrane protein TolC
LTSDYPKLHGIQFVPSENLVPVPMAFEVQESWRKGLAQRPDLQQARIDLERRDITLRYQKNQLFPALDFIGSYGHNGLNSSYGRVLDDLTKDENPSYSYGFRLSIPLGNARARNTYRATKAEKEQALLQIKKLEQDVMVQIDDAIKRVQTSFQRIEATRQARIFAEAALDAEQKKLENGKSTSFQVLQFQQRRTQAGYAEIAALSDYNNARSQLALVEGTTLERHRLNVSVK